MAQQVIGVGTVANDGTGDPLRTAYQKCNSNFTELYGDIKAAGGTANQIQWNNAGVLGGLTVGGDGTLSTAGALLVTKTSGVAFATSATTDTTNATNITSGTLPAAQLPNPTATTLGGIESIAAVSHKWIASISTSGVPSLTQPAAADVSGLAASATTDTTNASNITSGTLPAAQLPNPSATTLGGIESIAAVSHKWINAISTAGVPSLTQPAASDISGLATSATTDTTNASNITTGTLPAAQLPNPTATTLGGIESIAAVSHKWINTISTSGVPSLTQPAASDVSGLAASATTDTTNASNITTGTLPAAQLPNPSTTTLGGIESIAAVTSKWINSISNAGVPSLTQPSFTDINGTATTAQLPANSTLAAIEFVMDGAGSALGTGVKGYLEVPFGCTINRVTLLADQSGSVTIDLWKTTYANFDAGTTHPVVGDSITASAVPAIASATKYQDATLTGWTTSISAGDILAFDVKVAATSITRVTVSLKVTKT